MTTAIRRMTACAAALLAVSASTAHAQAAAAARPVSFGVSGGLSIPTGDFGDFFESGYNVGALLEFTPRVSPVAIRIEGDYQRFAVKGGDSETDLRMISGTANALFKFGSAAVVRPYVIGGLGLFNVGSTGDDGESENKFGYNVGGGLEIPLSGITVFGDVRFQQVRVGEDGESNFNLVPIKVGIRF
jgi:opacity protein-like surface antigen